MNQSISRANGQAHGSVEAIAPTSKTEHNVVNYPVTIRLDDVNLDGIRPGMTAVATLEQPPTSAGSWLVPINAIQQRSGQSIVAVVRNGATFPVAVEAGAIQGEWISVQSAELDAADEVVGSVASFVDSQAEEIFSN